MILNTNDGEGSLSKFLGIDEQRVKDIAATNRGYFVKYMIDLVMTGLSSEMEEKEYIEKGSRSENMLLKQIVENCRNIEEVVFVSLAFSDIIHQLLDGSVIALKSAMQVAEND